MRNKKWKKKKEANPSQNCRVGDDIMHIYARIFLILICSPALNPLHAMSQLNQLGMLVLKLPQP
jgi:hypothetical protein